MILYLILLTLAPDDALKLGTGQPWYEENKSKSQLIEGILDYQSPTGRIGVPTGYQPFRLVRRDAETGKVQQFVVHAPGSEPVLAMNVGQRVKVEGKIVPRSEASTPHEEIWIGTLHALGTAPVNVFSELKPLARASRLEPQSLHIGNNIATLVVRSARDAAKAMSMGTGLDAEKNASQYFANQFGVKAIDWKTQMVIYIGPVNQTRMSNNKREITKIEVHERGIMVYWKNDEMQQIGQRPSTDAVLVPRVDGDASFKQVDGKKTEGTKKDSPVDKLIPQAPIK